VVLCVSVCVLACFAVLRVALLFAVCTTRSAIRDVFCCFVCWRVCREQCNVCDESSHELYYFGNKQNTGAVSHEDDRRTLNQCWEPLYSYADIYIHRREREELEERKKRASRFERGGGGLGEISLLF